MDVVAVSHVITKPLIMLPPHDLPTVDGLPESMALAFGLVFCWAPDFDLCLVAHGLLFPYTFRGRVPLQLLFFYHCSTTQSRIWLAVGGGNSVLCCFNQGTIFSYAACSWQCPLVPWF